MIEASDYMCGLHTTAIASFCRCSWVERHTGFQAEDLDGFGVVAGVWPVPADSPLLSQRQRSFEAVETGRVVLKAITQAGVLSPIGALSE